LGVRRGPEVDREAATLEKSLRLRCEQRQRLRTGKHHHGERRRRAGHRDPRGNFDSRRKRTFVPSEVRRESYPAWWIACACSRGCSGVSSSHHSGRWSLRGSSKPIISSISSKVRMKSSRVSFERKSYSGSY